jgi:hypothetical protein
MMNIIPMMLSPARLTMIVAMMKTEEEQHRRKQNIAMMPM